MEACLLLLHIVIVEGELGPIAWIPAIIHASLASLLPASAPPRCSDVRYQKEQARVERIVDWKGH
jgi:hypothetical protein